jgi:hypothetical protein
MDADYSDYQYLPECTNGCGALTDWMPSNEAAHAVAHNHEKQTGHTWRVQQRMKEHPYQVTAREPESRLTGKNPH